MYSENAPERLPCDEFLIGVLSRAGRYLKLIVAWIVVILFNVFCIALHPLGQECVAGSQRVFMSRKLAFLWATLLYSSVIASSMLILTTIRIQVGDLGGGRGDSFFGNGGVVGAVLHLLSKYMKILCDWYFHKLIHFLGQPPRLIFLPPEAPLHEFGVIRRVLFFLDDDAFAVSLLHFSLSSSVFLHAILMLFCSFSPGPCYQRICFYSLYSSAILYWMGCISNCWWQQLFVWKLACYSWIHDDAVNLLCLLWNPLHSPSKPISSLSSLVFSRVSLHNSDIAMSPVGFLSKHITHQGCFCLVLQIWCSALDSWLVPRNLHLPYVWNQEFSDI